MKTEADVLNHANAKVLAELVADPKTTEQLRVRVLNKLLEAREGQSFFQTTFEENLSLGECPHCGHYNHWAVPEEDLGQMGYVSCEEDKRVPQTTDEEICPEFQQACIKKKLTV